MIDLHSHSTASDGELTPSLAAKNAFDHNLKVWALTDHDTVSGLTEAQNASKEFGITFVPGTELNIKWTSGEFHLLGLGLTHFSDELKSVISRLQNGRRWRNEQIVFKMNDDGFKVTLKELEEHFGTDVIGRPHIAEFLVEKKVVKRRQDAFNKFLGKGRPWYVDRYGADLEESVAAIKSAGGIPVIAHPLSLYVAWGKIEETLKDVKNKGVMGLEAWHPGTRNSEAFRLEEMARKLGFFVTAGSDYHGPNVRGDRRIGKTTGDRKIEDRFWEEELKPNLEKIGSDWNWKE